MMPFPEKPSYEALSFDDLVHEQEVVQCDKFQGRLLDEYNRYIVPGEEWYEPRSSAVADFLHPLISGEYVSLEGVLEGMYRVKGGEPVRWVDMGGGYGMAMRQLACDNAKRHITTMTNVDLLDCDPRSLNMEWKEHLEGEYPGILSEGVAPAFLRADMCTVNLPEPADIITSVETMQYLDDPLASIGNWYNQLADNGLMIVATEHDWAGRIGYRQQLNTHRNEDAPTAGLLEVLERNNIAFAASYEIDQADGYRPPLDPKRFCVLAIQRTPGTRLMINAPVIQVENNSYNYKTVYYEDMTGDSEIATVVTGA